jgi:hypothetical protein
MTEVRVDRFARELGHGFAVRTDCAVVAWPSIGDFCASKHARKGGLAGLDTALHPGKSELNARPMRRLGASRREFFDTIDRPALMPLPAEPYQYADTIAAVADIS